jgi:hypothetical protein
LITNSEKKPFSSPSVLKIKDVQDSASNVTSSSFSSRFNFPELHSKDSKNLREKVRGEIKKDSKVRDISSSFREQFEDHSSSSSSSQSSSLPHKKSESDLLNDLDKQVVKDLGMENADLFYYKMDPVLRSDLDNLILSSSSIFGEKKLVPPIHNNKGDITGYRMQKNVQSLQLLLKYFTNTPLIMMLRQLRIFLLFRLRKLRN